MRRLILAGTLGPTLLVSDAGGSGTWAAKLITTVPDDEREVLADALRARAAAQPAHSGLVPIVDIGIEDGGVYVITEWVDAPALDTRLRGGRQPLVQVLEWLAPVAAGLHAAHQEGGLHGAVHPRDVLLPRGGGTLTGLDISPALEALGLQAPVRVPFTAPERASGRRWDARADQYSLAMLALDALSGRRLIAGTIPAFDRWTLADTPGEDARLHEVFARALHPDPASRFDSVAEWLEALTGAAEPGTDLSRFTRDGVIPPAQPAPVRRAVEDEADVAVPLALFPAEDEEPEPLPAPVRHDDPADDTVRAPAQPTADEGGRQSPTGEWLVASMPDDVPPLADTGPLPIQSVHVDDADLPPAEPPTFSPPPQRPPEPLPPTTPDDPTVVAAAAWPHGDSSDAGDDIALHGPAGLGSEEPLDEFAPSDPEPPLRRQGPADDGDARWPAAEDAGNGGGGRTWLVAGAALLLLALVAIGTWRSLVSDEPRQAATPEPTGAPGADPGAAGPGGRGDSSSEGSGAGSAPAAGPNEIAEVPLRPSADDLAPGARPPAQGTDGAAAVGDASRAASPPPSRDVAAAATRTSATETGRSSRDAAPAPATAPAEQRLSLDRARILIRSSPAGDVRINGQPRGRTPLVLRDLPFGSYVIAISREGYLDAVQEVDMLPTQPVASIAVDLQRETGVGGGATPAARPPAPATPARAPAGQSPGRAASPAGTGSLYVVSRPADARLFVDGQAYGSAPAVVPGLAAGRHQVRVEYPGYRAWVSSVEVLPGQRVRVDATLVQEPR